MPVPLNETVGFGLPVSLFGIVIVAVFAPVVVGVNVTWNWALLPGVRVAPDGLLRMLNSPGFVPVSVSVPSDRLPVPLLVTVTFICELVVLTIWLPNGMLVGLTLMDGAGAASLSLIVTTVWNGVPMVAPPDALFRLRLNASLPSNRASSQIGIVIFLLVSPLANTSGTNVLSKSTPAVPQGAPPVAVSSEIV